MQIARSPIVAASLITLLVSTPAVGEEKPSPTEHRVEVLAGLGYTFTDDRAQNGRGQGGFLQGEYVFLPHSAVTPRLYAGLLLTFPDRDSCSAPSLCDVESKIFFIGGTVRAMAPIPWVGPFLELGLGASAGYLRTLDGVAFDETTRGVAIHVPVALGLALGRNHEYSVAFRYLFHPAQKQFGGAAAFGLAFEVP